MSSIAQEEILYQACKASQVKKIVYVGGAIALSRNPAGKPAHQDLSYPGQPENKNAYLQAKWAMDDLALRLAADGLPVSIARPSMTFGEFDFGPSTGQFLAGDKAKKALGFEAAVSLDEALKRSILWFSSVGYIHAAPSPVPGPDERGSQK